MLIRAYCFRMGEGYDCQAVAHKMNAPVSIAFADDHPMLLMGIVTLFENDPDYRVTGKAGCANSALDLVLEHKPDVIVMDLSMPGDIFRTISEMSAVVPHTRIVIFTAFSSIDSALKALDAGATGFVLKGSPCDELFDAVAAVMAGQMYITRQYAAQVMNGLREKNRRDSLREAVRLSVREKQIVGQLLQARTNREIAEELHISEKTVKHYMTGLMTKLKARNRVEVVIAARQHSESSSELSV
jgi:DNA-binding NarL/FixJ family response regulator